MTAGNFDGLSPQFETVVVLPAKPSGARARKAQEVLRKETIVIDFTVLLCVGGRLSLASVWLSLYSLLNPSLRANSFRGRRQ